jgi:hypothetical protein
VFRFPFPYFGSPSPYFGFWFRAQRFSCFHISVLRLPISVFGSVLKDFLCSVSVPRFPISLSAAVSGHRSFGISFSVLANRRTDGAILGEQATVFWYFVFFSLGCCSLHTVCAPPLIFTDGRWLRVDPAKADSCPVGS